MVLKPTCQNWPMVPWIRWHEVDPGSCSVELWKTPMRSSKKINNLHIWFVFHIYNMMNLLYVFWCMMWSDGRNRPQLYSHLLSSTAIQVGSRGSSEAGDGPWIFRSTPWGSTLDCGKHRWWHAKHYQEYNVPGQTKSSRINNDKLAVKGIWDLLIL